jgi:hypothetical protein
MSVTTNPTVNSINSSTTETPMTKTQIAAAASAAPIVQPTTVAAALAQLGAIRVKVSKSYKAMQGGRKKLYSDMQDTLLVYRKEFLNASTEAQMDFTKQLINLLDSDGVRVQKDSKVLPLFVKYVFKVNRQAANKYANRLTKAQDLLVPDEKIAEYLAGNYDDESAPATKTKQGKTALSEAEVKLKADAAETVEEHIRQCTSTPLGTVAFKNHRVQGEFVLLLGQPLNDGSAVNVVASLSYAPEELLKALKAALASIEEEELKSQQAIAAHAYTGTEHDFSYALADAANIPLMQNSGTGDEPVTTTAEMPEAVLA